MMRRKNSCCARGRRNAGKIRATRAQRTVLSLPSAPCGPSHKTTASTLMVSSTSFVRRCLPLLLLWSSSAMAWQTLRLSRIKSGFWSHNQGIPLVINSRTSNLLTPRLSLGVPPRVLASPTTTNLHRGNECTENKIRFASYGTHLCATPRLNGDWDGSDDDDDDELDSDDFPENSRADRRISAAPTTEKDNYVTEAEIAEQANQILLLSNNNLPPTSIDLPTELSNSFLQYALSIILGRAIPDGRDGLKPVHRRILFAMHELQLQSTRPHRKCARVVGDVLGKLHPHGDNAVYDALVRMAQDFTTNHPLIDGHGNFGSVDADPAAAMRYTECRLTALSEQALLQDWTEDAVNVVPNFDGTTQEPVVLPARIPFLLLNGAAGIAVGMATNVPPHNLRELMTACTRLTQSRRAEGVPVSADELLRIVPGPDFPTGGTILGVEGARQLYTTGQGGVILRAVAVTESIEARSSSSGSIKQPRTAIVVTELPYQVNKAALLEKLAQSVNDKKIEGIADLRDESSGREGVRVVIELKRDAVPAVVLANLYQKTALQTTFAGNLVALMAPQDSNSNSDSLVPQRFTLRQSLDCFLDFRFVTIRRQAQYRLNKVDARAHIVEGLLLALEKIDRVIDTVRKAATTVEARRLLQETILKTTTEQTDAILRLQLGQLTRLNKDKLQEELSELQESRAQLTRLLQMDEAVYDAMENEFQHLSETFGVDRKTQIIPDDDGTVDELHLVPNARSVIVMTRTGYLKRMPLQTFERQGRGTRGKRGTDDSTEVGHCFTCHDHDMLLLVTDAGIAYGVRAYQVPTSGRTARGVPLPSVVPQLRAGDLVTTILPVSEFDLPNEYLLLTTEQGWIKKTALAAFENLSNRGLTIAKLDEGDKILWCHRCRDGNDILVGTSAGMATRFAADKLRETGRTSRGVRAMKLREGDRIVDVNILPTAANDDGNGEYVLAVSSQGFGKRIPTSEFRTQARSGVGVIALKFKASAAGNDQMVCLRAVKNTDEILVITAKGIMVRQKASEISSQSRTATGVLVQKLDTGDHISSVSIVPEYDESDTE